MLVQISSDHLTGDRERAKSGQSKSVAFRRHAEGLHGISEGGGRHGQVGGLQYRRCHLPKDDESFCGAPVATPHESAGGSIASAAAVNVTVRLPLKAGVARIDTRCRLTTQSDGLDLLPDWLRPLAPPTTSLRTTRTYDQTPHGSTSGL